MLSECWVHALLRDPPWSISALAVHRLRTAGAALVCPSTVYIDRQRDTSALSPRSPFSRLCRSGMLDLRVTVQRDKAADSPDRFSHDYGANAFGRRATGITAASKRNAGAMAGCQGRALRQWHLLRRETGESQHLGWLLPLISSGRRRECRQARRRNSRTDTLP
jgi:hypothetical protein